MGAVEMGCPVEPGNDEGVDGNAMARRFRITAVLTVEGDTLDEASVWDAVSCAIHDQSDRDRSIRDGARHQSTRDDAAVIRVVSGAVQKMPAVDG